MNDNKPIKLKYSMNINQKSEILFNVNKDMR